MITIVWRITGYFCFFVYDAIAIEANLLEFIKDSSFIIFNKNNIDLTNVQMFITMCEKKATRLYRFPSVKSKIWTFNHSVYNTIKSDLTRSIKILQQTKWLDLLLQLIEDVRFILKLCKYLFSWGDYSRLYKRMFSIKFCKWLNKYSEIMFSAFDYLHSLTFMYAQIKWKQTNKEFFNNSHTLSWCQNARRGVG